MKMHRVLSSIALAAAMAAPVILPSSYARAADGDAVPALPPKPAANPLLTNVENFWHYAKIAKYDLAVPEAQKIIDSGAQPVDILGAFETVAQDRNDNLFDQLFKWQNVEPMKAVTQNLLAKLKEGQNGRYLDAKWIKDNIARLAVNQRSFEAALVNLRQSGEFAVPLMIDVLKDDTQKALHSSTRQALVRLGRGVLNPLVAVCETKDHNLLIRIYGILSDIKYDAAAPYIARGYASKEPGMEEVKSAAALALSRLGVDAKSAKASDLFYDLSEKFYYNNASIQADQRFPEAAHIWYWDDAKGLTNKDVPHPIFNEIMSMRCAEYSLKLEPNRADSVSLWLAANNKREVDLPEGKTDTTHEGPDAHFYNVALGTQYCNAVLARALKDRTAPVALKVVKSLQSIVGESNLMQGAEGKEPIIDALQFPDRLVRFEAAITVGSALPTKGFIGQELVVPTLAEAISNTGKANVVIISPDGNAANGLKESLKDAVKAETGTNAQTATEAAGRLPSVDIILVDSRGNKETDAVLSAPKVKTAAKVIIVDAKSSPYVASEMESPFVTTVVVPTGAPAPEAITAAIAKARAKAGSANIDDKVAEAYAQRAAVLLDRIAISHGGVLDINTAVPSLLRALEDPRIEIAKASANVLGRVNSKEAQSALAAKGAEEKASDDLKIAAFKGLAESAKAFGNQLDPSAVEGLQKVVETSANLNLKSAAGEAQGALNLPADRAKNLIINQSQVGK